MPGTCSLLLMCVVFVMVSSQSCNNNKLVNGCSVPFGLNWYRNQFRSACNRHDVCYSCGYTLKISRRTCDRAFKRDMEKTCPPRKTWFRNRHRTNCMSAAFTYYSGVRVGGGLPVYWNRKIVGECYKPWVRRCMP